MLHRRFACHRLRVIYGERWLKEKECVRSLAEQVAYNFVLLSTNGESLCLNSVFR
jgi:hypothetical protein